MTNGFCDQIVLFVYQEHGGAIHYLRWVRKIECDDKR